MSKFVKSQNIIRFEEFQSKVELDLLPPKVYSLKTDVFGFYFEEMEEFSLPRKIYGDNSALRERIMKTFFSRKNSTGVLLSGLQGSGKSLLIKELSIHLLKEEIPTILINSPFCDEEFKILLSKIKQECFIVFDEFEKVYSEERHQESLLSLFDGVYLNERKLIAFSANNVHALSRFLLNRPGRIFYHFKFQGMEETHIRSYCEDKLDNSLDKEKIISDLISLSENSFFNFDLLQAFVEEINRFPEDNIAKLSNMINIAFVSDNEERFELIKVEAKNKDFDVIKFVPHMFNLNLMDQNYPSDCYFDFYPSKEYFEKYNPSHELDDYEDDDRSIIKSKSKKDKLVRVQGIFRSNRLVYSDNKAKIFVFESDECFIHLRKVKKTLYKSSYGAF